MRYVLTLCLPAVLCFLPAWGLTAERGAKLLPSDGTANDQFGSAAAIDGDTAVIGAVHGQGNSTTSGAVYVFTHSVGVWTQQAKLFSDHGGHVDNFGIALALNGDTAVVGAYRHGHDLVWGGGAAYVFTHNVGVWSQQAELLADDAAEHDNFGISVAVDGNTAIIGARGDDDNGLQSGSAYVFTRLLGVWRQRAKLLPADGEGYDEFGIALALDGDTAVIGACHDDDNGESSGSAYVFTHSAGVWTEQAKLLPSDGEESDEFGASVALDGDTAVIGAKQDYDNGEHSGAAYVFTRAAGVWTEQAKLLPCDGEEFDEFGVSVAVDGDTAVIGAKQDDDNRSGPGSAYVFARAAGVWTEQARLRAPDGAENDLFGSSVALDGERAVIGAPFDDDNGEDSGSAYVCRLYDGDVPATGMVGALALLLAVLGIGVYLSRRRDAT